MSILIKTQIWVQAQLCAFSDWWGWASLRHLQKGVNHPWQFYSMVWKLYDVTDVQVSVHCKLLRRHMRFLLSRSKQSRGRPTQFLDKLTEEKCIAQIWQSWSSTQLRVRRSEPEGTKGSMWRASHRTACSLHQFSRLQQTVWDLSIPPGIPLLSVTLHSQLRFSLVYQKTKVMREGNRREDF